MNRIQLVGYCLLFTNISGHAEEISLSDAQQLLLTNNKQLRAVHHGVERQTLLVQQAKASFQPQLSAAASYGLQSKTNHISFTLSQPVPLSIDRDLGDKDRVELGVDVNYPIFTGFSRTHALEQARHTLKAEESRYASVKNQLLFALGAQFITWDVAVKKVAVQEKLVKQIDEHIRRMELLRDGGVLVNSDVLKAKAAGAKARVGLLAAQNSADSLRIAIAALIGVDQTAVSLLPLAAKPAAVMKPVESPVSLNTDRPELVLINENKKQLEAANRALFGQRLPLLAATAGLRYANPGLDMGGDDFMGYGIAGLRLSWTLYDGMANRYQRASLTKQEAMLDDQEQEMVVSWQAAIAQSTQACKTAGEMVTAAQASLEAAQQYTRNMQNAQEAGTATAVDLLQALTDEAEAAFEYEKARAMVSMTALQLRFVAGEEIKY